MRDHELFMAWADALLGKKIPGLDPERAKMYRTWADNLRDIADEMEREAEKYDDHYEGVDSFLKDIVPATEIPRVIRFGPWKDGDPEGNVYEIRSPSSNTEEKS